MEKTIAAKTILTTIRPPVHETSAAFEAIRRTARRRKSGIEFVLFYAGKNNLIFGLIEKIRSLLWPALFTKKAGR